MTANTYTYISLGYRCSTAGILKYLGKKTESYPFDWLISRLPIIQHCIETRFRYFIDPQYYTEKKTHTTHYHEGTTPTPLKICDEIIYENHYYRELFENASSHPHSLYIPAPLTTENGDTYAHLCAMNHRDIRQTETQEYYARCIDRFYGLFHHPQKTIMGLYIHPAITEEEYANQSQQIQEEFRAFYSQIMEPNTWSATFFIMVRTNHPYPITNYKPKVVECIYECASLFYEDKSSSDNPRTPTLVPRSLLREGVLAKSTIRIYVVYTNRDFIDAGEIFMQNAYIETDTMCELIATFSE